MIYQMLRYWSELLQPYKPLGWSISNSVIFENDSLRLRSFTPKSNKEKTPILILAPNAGHHQNIAEPLIHRCLKTDIEREVCLVDWIPPTPVSRNRHDSLDDIISQVANCVEVLGDRVHLFTLCQGAWVGAIYAALYPDTVVSYVNAAGPLDFRAGGGKIQEMCQSLPFSFYENMVDMCGGVQKGDNMLLGFKSMNPYDRYVGDYLDLWYAVCDEDQKAIDKWHRFKDWYDQPQNIPGVWYLEAVDKLFCKNQLIKGELEILGRKVDLSKITCPVHLIGGDKDDITLPDQVFNMAKYVSGPTSKKLLENAGHIGVFVKESSLRYWETNILNQLDSIGIPGK